MLNTEKLTDDVLDTVAGGAFNPTAHTVQVTATNYDLFINSARNVIILIGADWCHPSNLNASMLEEFAAVKDENTRVGTMDIDNPINDNLMRQLQVTHLPVTMRFQQGRLVERTVGAMRREDMQQLFR